MAIKLTAKGYINGLSYDEFKEVRVVAESPGFMQFLVPCNDVVAAATLSSKFADVGVPNGLLGSPEAIHFLAVAINNRVCGNA